MKMHRLAGADCSPCLLSCGRRPPPRTTPYFPRLSEGRLVARQLRRDGARRRPRRLLDADLAAHVEPGPAPRHHPRRPGGLGEDHRATRNRRARPAISARAPRRTTPCSPTDIAQALNDVALTNDPAERLAIVQKARKTLADWPAGHFNFKQDEIHQMLGTLDEAIAELRAATGAQQFDLALVAATPAPAERVPLLPPPTLAGVDRADAARRAPHAVARRAHVAADGRRRARSTATPHRCRPTGWRRRERRRRTAIARELRDRPRLPVAAATRMMKLADRPRARRRRARRRAAAGRDHGAGRGARRAQARRGDALLASVEQQLDAARRLRLERDRWAMRLPELRALSRSRSGRSSSGSARLKPSLEDIKALAGSSHGTLERARARAAAGDAEPARSSRRRMNIGTSTRCSPAPRNWPTAPPASAARRCSPATARAWDASSAAAGALMLTARAQSEILRAALRPPATATVITPRRTRLVRVPDLHAFRAAIARARSPTAGSRRRGRARGDRADARRGASQLRADHRAALGAGGAAAAAADARQLYDTLHARLADPPRRLTAVRARQPRAGGRAPRGRGSAGSAVQVRPGLVAEILRFYDQLRRQSQQVKRFEELIVEALGGEPGRSRRRTPAAADAVHRRHVPRIRTARGRHRRLRRTHASRALDRRAGGRAAGARRS